MDLRSDIQYVKGVGSVRAQSFHRLGVDTVGALLRFYPRTYEDWSRITPIQEAVLGENCCILATVCHTPTKHRIPGGMLLYKTSVTDGRGIVNLTFFNNKYIGNLLKENEEYLFFGKITAGKFGGREMASPQFLKPSKVSGLRPVYPQSGTLTSRMIENSVRQALSGAGDSVRDPMPEAMREQYRLCTLREAIQNIHFPKSAEDLKAARKRLIFDELFTLSAGLMCMKNRNDGKRTSCIPTADYTDEFYKLLPFAPTGAQKKAVRDILRDVCSGEPMSRLLQGDVGSGKTAVAAAATYTFYKSGMQTAIMAPTEVLAEQHYRTFSRFFAETGAETVLLTGSMSAAEKRKTKAEISSGGAHIVIGTHALIQDDVQFHRLGFVVTDEQHRFGVAQRSSLTAKGENPHILVMSATPIPRTLGLILYGDLNVSILDELPPGRQTVETYRVTRDYHPRIYKYIQKHLDKGLQGYIVCPLVEEGESNLIPASEYARELSRGAFQNYRVGLLHGQMKPSEKDKIMRAFQNGEIDLLVSTVVIEVGVDVPNAAIMVIEDAERFGLSQLHQLRGRVGRGTEKSTCILVSDAQNEEAKRRFDILCKTNDGFLIADEDLKMRGPGDFFGKKQHGLPELHIADLLTDTEILMQAQTAAKEILAGDSALEKEENRWVKRLVDKLFSAFMSGSLEA